MDATTFDALLGRRQRLTRDVLGAKAGEYASDADRLHNFREAARLLGGTPEAACLGMMVKHFVSVADLVKSDRPVPQAYLDEKIGDLINYCHLLEGLLQHRVRGPAE